MTLVVARQIDNDVYLIGDSKFSENIENTQSESEKYIGGLKLVILAPGLCVGFAGNVDYARKAIQGIYDSEVNLFDKDCVIDYFLKWNAISVNTGFPTDFIIAAILKNNEKPGTFLSEIFKITDSKVSLQNDTAHIGNADAFNSFQNISHNGTLNTNSPILEIWRQLENASSDYNKSLSTAMRAMQGVVDDASVLDVDGIRTVVVSDESQFKYFQYLQIRGAPIPVNNETNAPVSFGGAAEGSDHKHVGMFSAMGHGVFPVYWITGCFGVIYHPEKSFKPTIISNCSQEQFRLLVVKQISITHQRALNYQNRV